MPAKSSVQEPATRVSTKEIETHALFRKNLVLNLLVEAKFPGPLSNTHWEELTCIGYNPLLSQLEGVVSIKQSTGYGGNLCTFGSTEYVRFFVDWGDGAGFQDVGLTSFKVHDISDAPPGPQHPLQYMVFLPLNDKPHRDCCDDPVLPKVRGVLSYNVPPTLNPNAVPFYGNRLDANIQLRPGPFNIWCLLEDFIELKDPKIKLPPKLSLVDMNAELPKLKPSPVPWKELAPVYRKAEVPDHRLVYEVVQPMIKSSSMPAPLSMQIEPGIFKELKIDIAKLIDVLGEKKSNTTFEELTCVGLNLDSDILGGVIHVKKPYGYSGSLCQAGSHEYVAFWADWNNDGVFDEYLGTASVETHDLVKLPGGDLSYSVMLPCNFSKHLKTCDTPVVVRIRGVLSWAVPPSTTDPNLLNYWGNSLDVVVQLRPVDVPPGTGLIDLIYDVGNVTLPNISPFTHLAFPAPVPLNSAQCNMGPWDRPFGGAVRVGGRIYNTGPAGSVYFRVEYSPSGAGSWLPVTNTVTFQLMHPLPWDPKYPEEDLTFNSPDGWFPYMEDPTASPPIFERTALLSYWQTGALTGYYDLRLVYCLGDPHALGAVFHYSAVVTIKLDNHGFTVSPTANAVLDKAYDLDLIINGGDCHSYVHGVDMINGKLHAVTDNFWKWEFDLQPTTHTHGVNASPACRSYVSLVDNGDDEVNWTLNTTHLDPCGYTLTLWAYDRTIVDSGGSVHWNRKAVGFSVT